MDLFGIHFASPWFLAALPLVPFLAILVGRRGGAPAVRFSDTTALRALGGKRRSHAGAVLAGLALLALALFLIALARPQKGNSVSTTQASGIDIVIALDVSRSMLAEDFTLGGQRANRLEAIKQVTRDFISGRPGDRIGIVAFAGQPYLVSPLTLDHDWLIQNLERIKIGMVEDGTAIGSAIASATNRLKSRDAKTRLVVLLTDGDNNAGRITPNTAAEAAKTLGVKIYTIGAGTRGLAPYPVGRDMFGALLYRNMQMEFNEEGLKQIATLTDGQYFRATDTKSLVEIFKKIDQFEKTTFEVQRHMNYNDLFVWFAGAGAIALMLSLLLSQTLLRRLP